MIIPNQNNLNQKIHSSNLLINNILPNGETLLTDAIIHDNFELVKQLITDGASVNQENKSLEAPLALAVEKGNIKIIEFLSNHPEININGRGKFYATPLIIACEKNREDIVSLLLTKNADISLSDTDGTPLFYACSQNNEKIVQLLLDKGSEITSTEIQVVLKIGNLKILEQFFKKDSTVAYKLLYEQTTPLHLAIENHSYEVAKYLLSWRANPYSLDSQNDSPLSLAIKDGNIEFIKYFLENFPCIPYFNAGLVLNALDCGKVEIAELLIEKGGLNPPNIVDSKGLSLLHRAVFLQNANFVDFLLKNHASPALKTNDGKSPLHFAFGQPYHLENVKIIELLLKADPNLIHIPDNQGNYPLHSAAYSGVKEYIDPLLSQSCDINQRNYNGSTPLFQAISNRQYNAAKYLVQKKADVNMKDYNDYTPLHMAALYGNGDLIEFLLNNKAKSTVLTNQQKTPMHFAVETGQIDVVEALAKSSNPIVNFYSDDQGYYPIHLAVQKGNLHIAQLLLPKSNIDSKTNNKQGYTPLHIAIQNNNFDMMKLLIDNGADTSIKSKDEEKTALFFAIKMQNPLMTEYLLKNHADPSVEDSFKYTCLDYAIYLGNYEIVKQIIQMHPTSVKAVNSTGNSPLIYANNKQMVQLLIQNGADPDKVNQIDTNTAAGSRFLAGDYSLGKWLMEQEIFDTSEVIHDIKMMGHRFGLSVTLNLKDSTLFSRGLNTYVTHSLVAHSVKHTTQWIGKAPSKIGWTSSDTAAIVDSLEKGISTKVQNDSNDSLTKALIANYQKNEIVVIPVSFAMTGDTSHAVTVILYKDMLIKCNRWDPQSGMEIFKINEPAKIEEAISHLVSFHNQVENRQFFLKGGIEKMLNLQPIKLIKHSSQKAGTCAWTNSAKQAFHGTLYLYLLRKGYNEQEAEKYSEEMYKAWVLEDQTNAIENFAAKYPSLKTHFLSYIYDHVSVKDQTERTKPILDKIEKISPESVKMAKERQKRGEGRPPKQPGILNAIAYTDTIQENFFGGLAQKQKNIP